MSTLAKRRKKSDRTKLREMVLSLPFPKKERTRLLRRLDRMSRAEVRAAYASVGVAITAATTQAFEGLFSLLNVLSGKVRT